MVSRYLIDICFLEDGFDEALIDLSTGVWFSGQSYVNDWPNDPDILPLYSLDVFLIGIER